MLQTLKAVEEAGRLAAIREYGVNALPRDPGLARVVRLAASLFDVPMAAISLAEQDRQLYAVRYGLDLIEMPLAGSFCAHVVTAGTPLLVLDASLDTRFADKPLVAGLINLRFYAGAPLIAPSGHVIGTIGVADIKPRAAFSESDQRNLADLAVLVMDKMELLRLNLARHAGPAEFERIAANSPDAIFCADTMGQVTFWNGAAARLSGYDAAEVEGHGLELIAPRRVFDSLAALASAGAARDCRVVELDIARKNGGDVPVELSLWIWRHGGRASFGAIMRAVSERRANEERLCRLAHLDPLTGLPNRILLRNRIEQAIGQYYAATVMRIDLSGLKDVNDGLGHVAGDAVLAQAAEHLRAALGPSDVVGRVGGDEFAVLVPGLDNAEAAAKLADDLIETLTKIRLVDGEPVSIGANCGIALFPLHGVSAEALLSGAELALFQARAEGRHGKRFFSPGLRQAATAKRAFQNELRHACETGEFELFYQPQIRLVDGALVGAEALMRWRHPEKGLLAPGVFLPALETGALAAPLGEWALRTACAQTATWKAQGAPDLHIAVNLFGAQFRAGDLAAKVRGALLAAGLAAAALELEITENIILRHDDDILAPLTALREEGVGITFDDYGTGYASFSMLKRFPVTRLKIDRSFVHGMCESSSDSAIVRAILYLGRSLGLGVIAEGVETTEQSQLLRRKGCEQVQGFLTGRPMPPAEFARRFGLGASRAAGVPADAQLTAASTG